jgi:hypothetical protein
VHQTKIQQKKKSGLYIFPYFLIYPGMNTSMYSTHLYKVLLDLWSTQHCCTAFIYLHLKLIIENNDLNDKTIIKTVNLSSSLGNKIEINENMFRKQYNMINVEK